MATKKKDPRAATCRPKGIIGSDPLVYRAFRAHFSIKDINVGPNNRGMWVLDFGAGEGAVNTSRLRKSGYEFVWAHDLPENTPHPASPYGVWCMDVKAAVWDVVLLSNVLNVQTSKVAVRKILSSIKRIMRYGGTVFVNYPLEPRKSSMTVEGLVKILNVVFNPTEIRLVGGTKRAPCFMVKF